MRSLMVALLLQLQTIPGFDGIAPAPTAMKVVNEAEAVLKFTGPPAELVHAVVWEPEGEEGSIRLTPYLHYERDEIVRVAVDGAICSHSMARCDVQLHINYGAERRVKDFELITIAGRYAMASDEGGRTEAIGWGIVGEYKFHFFRRKDNEWIRVFADEVLSKGLCAQLMKDPRAFGEKCSFIPPG